MKKSKLLILGVIAMLLAGGLALASCEEPTACEGGCGKAYNYKGQSSGCDGYCQAGETIDSPLGGQTKGRCTCK